MIKAEIDRLIDELARVKECSVDERGTRSAKLYENGEVEYNFEGLHKRIFRSLEHFGAWLACGHSEDEHTRPIRQYFYNSEKSDLAGEEVFEELNPVQPPAPVFPFPEHQVFHDLIHGYAEGQIVLTRGVIGGIETSIACIMVSKDSSQTTVIPVAVLVNPDIEKLITPLKGDKV